jgi:outer membrane protein OmpA-like peptidoglycan-associated protein
MGTLVIKHIGLALVVSVAALSGCEGAGHTASAAPKAEDCAKLAAIPPLDTPGVSALVVDNTASGVAGALPPGIRDGLVAAQKRKDRLVIVPVDGAGKPGRISRTVALDPYPRSEAETSNNARRIAIECAATWMRESAAQPTVAGSDILTALNAASREHPTAILVVSDGLANAGEFNLGRDGFDADPARLAGDLAASGSLASTLTGRNVVWTGLGGTARALPNSLTGSLQGLWSAVLTKSGAKPAFDTRAGGATEPINGTQPDPLKIPDATRKTTPCGEQIVVPAALLFAPGSPDLQKGTDSVLRQAADGLGANPTWAAVIEGHTANYDTAAERKALSEQRAQAVVDALVQLGVDGGRLTPKGYGATKPAVPEIVGGNHDQAAATKNRRVVINIGPKGCVS